MKKLHLYIMCGLSFSGKTTQAKELVNRFGIKQVSIDEILRFSEMISPEEWVHLRLLEKQVERDR